MLGPYGSQTALWPGRRGVRASVAQQPVSAEAGAPSAGETVLAVATVFTVLSSTWKLAILIYIQLHVNIW